VKPRSIHRRSSCIRSTAAAAALTVLLHGCGVFATPEVTPPCPRVAVLADAARLIKFRPGPGRDLTDVDFEALIGGVDGTCSYDRRRSHVDVDFVIEMEVSRGPANGSRQAPVEFFVAVIDPNQNILGKETFTSNVRFQDNMTRVRVTENIAPRLPLKDIKVGGSYSVFVGLQLTAEELNYLRTRGR